MPCLIVTMDCPVHTLKCRYPHCKTVVTNDEFCRKDDFDVREYYNSDWPDTPYIPLGPRIDSWTSFQKITTAQGDSFSIQPASKRKYAFNAIFSITHRGRAKLANVIDRHDNSGWSIFTQISEKWTKDVNDPSSSQLHTDHYMQVVLDSTFTLSPAGHNPECYRLFEAMEAGSIPVFVRDEGYENHQCKQSLHAWLDEDPKAPMVVLKSWEDLYPTLQELLKDPAALDARQAKLRAWYDHYMRKVTADFESYLLQSI